MKGPSRLVGILLGVVGAVVGGVVGYYLCAWMLRYDLYAIILPATLVGVGFGLLSRQKCVLCGIACGVAGVALGIFTEWRLMPFVEDQSLSFFLAHLHELSPVKLLLMGLGGLCSFWFGMGREAADGRQSGPPTAAREHADSAAGEQ
jgi:hypothetical protein